jgi:pentatricopeptide repeat protein
MTSRMPAGFRFTLLFLLVLSASSGVASVAQEKPKPTAPIDLDRALQAPVAQDRGQSYYYFSLAKWFEEKGNLDRAVSNMRTALRYDSPSSALRVELAGLLLKAGDLQESLEVAEEAAKINPKDPEPHWLLANIHLGLEGRGRRPSEESLKKAAKELEAMKEDAPGDERSYFRLGQVYFSLNQPEKAIEAYEKFQSLVPDSVDDGYMAIADYYQRTGDEQKKIEYLQKAVAKSPESAQSLTALAAAYSKLGKEKEAIPLLRKAIELSDGNPLIKKQLAMSLVSAGEHSEAKSVLADLLRIDPGDNSTKVLLGRVQLGEKHYSEAIETFKGVLQEVPDFLEAEFYLGDAYEQSGDPVSAARVYSDLAAKSKDGTDEYQSNLPVFQQRLASAYQQMGETQKAIAIYEEMIKGQSTPDMRVIFLLINGLRVDRQYERALALGKQYHDKNPADDGITLVYARTLADAGKTKEGAELLTKLLASDPKNLDAYINLSQIYIQGQRYSEAEQTLKRADTLDLDSQRVQLQLATLYEKQKDYARAESVLNALLEKEPNSAIVLNFLGYMLADRGVRLEEAVKFIQGALEQEPSNGAYLDSLGWAYFRMSDLDKAEEYLLKAIGQIKNDPEIYDHLGDLYLKKGDLEKAREYWQRSMANGIEPDQSRRVRDKLGKLPKPKKP